MPYLESVWGSKDGLFVLIALVLMGTVVCATIAYIFEVEQPGTHFTSIPASFWWATSTIMAVGYGFENFIPSRIPSKK